MARTGLWLAIALSTFGPLVAAAQNPPPPPASATQPQYCAPAPAPFNPMQTAGGQTAAAQAASAAAGRQVTNQQIAAAIQQSGMSEDQIRQRLTSAGYDSSLADPFFASRRGGAAAGAAATGPGGGAAPSSDFVSALQRLCILKTVGGTEGATGAAEGATAESSPAAAAASPALQVFGKDIFNRASTAFDPVTSGPVDPAYRLGIGDVLQLVVTGQVELAYEMDIRRDGTVIVPQVGQIPLAGLTLDAARTLLRLRMGKSYSGLTNGEARLDLTITQLRTNAVFVIGEVERPGAVQVSALATVFQALAHAGGPTDRGSFRDIEVRRAGKVVERLDLYDYLLTGDAAGDIRLEQGDVIYVPLNTRVVSVTGAVRRPRIFQLREKEGFNDLLRFAGGLLPTASVERVQIDRILPPERRKPGVERVKVDVELAGRLDSLGRVTLLDGDSVHVFTVDSLRRNVVKLAGQVYQPGEYQLKPNMTLGQLLTEAQGTMPWALPDRVKVLRTDLATARDSLYSVDATSPAGRSFELQEFDAVQVLDARTEYPSGWISVDGAVNAPVTNTWAEHESLRDAIERAGGLREDAQTVDVFRHRTGANFSDTTSVRFHFALSPTFAHDTTLSGFALERDDHVYVRPSPGFRPQAFVTVAGFFVHPGEYAITQNSDHVRQVVELAGNVLPGAYPQSFRLVRGGKLVSVDFGRAMGGDDRHDLSLLAGDSLVIDRDPGTVFVTGAVNRPSLIRFQSDRSINDYIELAGGPAENGMAGKAVINYPSGFSRRVRRVALLFHSSPPVESGSTITVPAKPPSTTSAGEIWGRVLTSASALASLILTVAALKRL